MKLVLSTYQQLVRYSTSTGTANIRGDQAMSRTISVVTRKKSRWRLKTAKTVFEEELHERKKLK